MKKVLCVDDSALVRKDVKKVLEPMGYIVLEAENGEVALNTFLSNSDIKLIFCDVNMPVMNGIQFCERLFEMGIVPNIPIIMFTTESSEELKSKAKTLGVRGWLAKPFTAVKISSIIKKLFESGEGVSRV